jgi:XTP/dITP diphosphohydrolase
MREVVLATKNAGKIKEFERILAEHATQVKVLGLNDFPDMPDVEETGSSFEENSLLKATAIAHYTNLPAIADDSGLCVDALNGDPGIYSARWAGTHGDDKANNEKVIDQLKNEINRNAKFRCVVTLVIPKASGDLVLVESGEVTGIIIDQPRGDAGFGYDPIFQPSGYDITFGEFANGEKDKISHRGRALRMIAPRLFELL